MVLLLLGEVAGARGGLVGPLPGEQNQIKQQRWVGTRNPLLGALVLYEATKVEAL